MNPKETLNPAEPLPKQSDEQFCQLIAAGNEPYQAYKQAVYRGTEQLGKQKFKAKAYRKMKQEYVRARVEYLREQVRKRTEGAGIDRADLLQSLTQKYWEAFNAPCATMRDRADQARVLETLANRISLLSGIDKAPTKVPKLNFVRKEKRDAAELVAPPPREGGGSFSTSEGGGKKTRPEELE